MPQNNTRKPRVPAVHGKPCVKCGYTLRNAHNACVMCQRKYSSVWYAANRERATKTVRAHILADPAKAKAKANASSKKRADNGKTFAYTLWQNYKITVEQYDAMLLEQGGLCAICRKPEKKKRALAEAPMRLSVDHDHACCSGSRSCGLCVRGLLCGLCNLGIAHLTDDPTTLRAAADYIERWPKKAPVDASAHAHIQDALADQGRVRPWSTH